MKRYSNALIIWPLPNSGTKQSLNLIVNTLTTFSEVDTWTWTSRSIRCQDFWDARAFDSVIVFFCHMITFHQPISTGLFHVPPPRPEINANLVYE